LLTIWDAGGVDAVFATNNGKSPWEMAPAFFPSLTCAKARESQIGFCRKPGQTLTQPRPNGFGWRSAWPNIYIAYGAVVENAVGSNGKDIITGNGVNKKLLAGR